MKSLIIILLLFTVFTAKSQVVTTLYRNDNSQVTTWSIKGKSIIINNKTYPFTLVSADLEKCVGTITKGNNTYTFEAYFAKPYVDKIKIYNNKKQLIEVFDNFN